MLTVEVEDDWVVVWGDEDDWVVVCRDAGVVVRGDGCDVVEGLAAFPPPPLHLMIWRLYPVVDMWVEWVIWVATMANLNELAMLMVMMGVMCLVSLMVKLVATPLAIVVVVVLIAVVVMCGVVVLMAVVVMCGVVVLMAVVVVVMMIVGVFAVLAPQPPSSGLFLREPLTFAPSSSSSSPLSPCGAPPLHRCRPMLWTRGTYLLVP